MLKDRRFTHSYGLILRNGIGRIAEEFRARSTLADRFYTTGGTLSQDSPSYVERQADRALIEGLVRGEYCYILTSRQMGKSSLMIRTASRLREGEDSVVAVLDLAAVGQNLNPEQWYDGMLLRLGRQLGLEDEFDDFWLDNPRLGPVQRFFEALYQVVLVKSERRLIIFVDELDTVRSLPFSSDEFFAAIRQCFNERSADPVWARLTFCLLGVATPSDLIKDPHISPFNIGRRIVLEDFKKDEVAKLVEGLEADDRGEILLERIFGWTNGHPYLTQRLCRAVAEQNRSEDDPSILQPGAVDGICHRLFLSNRAKERDDNLIFVRERLLRSDHDRAAVLDLYRKVRSGVQVVDDETNPLIGTLHLSGVTQIDKGKLRVRNRIYRHVFSPSWIEATMPDAEKRRQKEAYRRGVIRTTALSLAVMIVVVYLGITAYIQSERARARLISQNTDHGSRLLEAGENYDALAWFVENLNLTRDGSVAEELGRKRFASVLRHSPRLVEILPHEGPVRHLGFSPDDDFLLTVGDDQLARVWDIETASPSFDPLPHGSSVVFGEYSPDGKSFVTASSDQAARIYAFPSGQQIGQEMEHDYEVTKAVFSGDGSKIATASLDDTARIWDATNGKPISDPLQHRYQVNDVSFSPDGRYLLTASKDGTARLWSANSKNVRLLRTFEHEDSVVEARFSLDSDRVATGTRGGWLRVWAVSDGKQIFSMDHPAGVTSIRFAPNGQVLAVGCGDGLVRLIDLESYQIMAAPLVHRDPVRSVQFSPAGDLLLSVTEGNEARVWDAMSGRAVSPPFRHLDHIYHAAFDHSGRRVATAGADHLVKLWDLAGVSAQKNEWVESESVTAVAHSPDGRKVAYSIKSGAIRVRNSEDGSPIANAQVDHGGEVQYLCFGPDSRRLLSAGFAGKARLWDLTTGSPLHEFDHQDTINFALFNRMGNRLITASRDRRAVLWNVETGEQAIAPVEHNYSVVNAGFSAGGREFVTASADNSVSVWSALTGKRVRGPFRPGYTLGRPAFDDEGERFIALVSANKARVFSLADGRPLSKEMEHRAAIRFLSFDSAGGRILTASEDHTARVWDAWEGEPLSPPLRHGAAVIGGAFSTDNHQLMSVGLDDSVRLWSARNGAPLAPAFRHTGPVTLADLGADGRNLLTVSSNRVIQWGLETEARPQEILFREAELLSGRRRDVTGELMGMSATNLLASWSFLLETHPEFFTVSAGQKFRWHAKSLRRAINREDAFAATFHMEALAPWKADRAEEFAQLKNAFDESVRKQDQALEDLSPMLVERGYMASLPGRLPRRDPALDASILDLTSFYNGHLEDAWQATGTAGNDLSGITPGLNQLAGKDFDIRGAVQLGSRRLKQNSRRSFPESIIGIPVGRFCQRVHLIHAVAYPTSAGDVVGTYAFEFENGERYEHPITYGNDVADWWYVERLADREVETKIVWSERTSNVRLVRLFMTTVELPANEQLLTSIDLIGGETDSAPFVLGITVE